MALRHFCEQVSPFSFSAWQKNTLSYAGDKQSGESSAPANPELKCDTCAEIVRFDRVLGNTSNAEGSPARDQNRTACAVPCGKCSWMVAGEVNVNPSGPNEKTLLSAPLGGDEVSAVMVIIVGAASAPAGTSTDGPPLKLTIPPLGPTTALLLMGSLVPRSQPASAQVSLSTSESASTWAEPSGLEPSAGWASPQAHKGAIRRMRTSRLPDQIVLSCLSFLRRSVVVVNIRQSLSESNLIGMQPNPSVGDVVYWRRPSTKPWLRQTELRSHAVLHVPLDLAFAGGRHRTLTGLTDAQLEYPKPASREKLTIDAYNLEFDHQTPPCLSPRSTFRRGARTHGA